MGQFLKLVDFYQRRRPGLPADQVRDLAKAYMQSKTAPALSTTLAPGMAPFHPPVVPMGGFMRHPQGAARRWSAFPASAAGVVGKASFFAFPWNLGLTELP